MQWWRHSWTRILWHVLVLLWVVYPTHQVLNLKLFNPWRASVTRKAGSTPESIDLVFANVASVLSRNVIDHLKDFHHPCSWRESGSTGTVNRLFHNTHTKGQEATDLCTSSHWYSHWTSRNVPRHLLPVEKSFVSADRPKSSQPSCSLHILQRDLLFKPFQLALHTPELFVCSPCLVYPSLAPALLTPS
jgi:hypothetical protein